MHPEKPVTLGRPSTDNQPGAHRGRDMEKLLDYLNQWGQAGEKGKEIDFDLADFWYPKENTTAFHLHFYGVFLLEKGYINNTPGGEEPPARAFLLEKYREILDGELASGIAPHVRLYYNLYAAFYFFDVLIYSLETPSAKLLFKLDAFIFNAVADILHTISYKEGISQGEKSKVTKNKKAQRQGMRKKYNTEERRAAVYKIAARIKHKKFNQLVDGVLEKMKSEHTTGGPEPYGKTHIKNLLKGKYYKVA